MKKVSSILFNPTNVFHLIFEPIFLTYAYL